MQATLVSYRRGRTTQTDNQMIAHVEGVASKEEAQKIVGKSAVYKTSSGKEIKGTVKAAHGNSGAVRILFETGMPGQSLATKITLN